MQTKKRVIIIGAGPAGLSAAIELGKNKNFEVIVLDKNSEPSYKVCGGGIDIKFIKAAVAEDIMEKEFGSFNIITPKSSFRVGDGSVLFVGTLNRKTLNEKLSGKALAAGAQILYGQTVKEVFKDKIATGSGKEFAFDYLIGADGINSVVRKSLGLQTKKFLVAYQYMIPGHYDKMDFYLDFKRFGITYNWIFPQKDVISVGTGYAAIEGKPQEELKRLRENFDDWCKERFDLSNARFEGFTINYDYQGFEFGNVYLAGDAGGFASGLTGEGIKPAMLSGQDIARRIQDPTYVCSSIKHCLKSKRTEDGLLNLLINKPFGKATVSVCSALIDFPWFKKALLRIL